MDAKSIENILKELDKIEVTKVNSKNKFVLLDSKWNINLTKNNQIIFCLVLEYYDSNGEKNKKTLIFDRQKFEVI